MWLAVALVLSFLGIRATPLKNYNSTIIISTTNPLGIYMETDRKCVTHKDNLPRASEHWGKEGWRCSNIRPEDQVRLCLPVGWLCDGRNDCGDKEDEGEICGGFDKDRACSNPFTAESKTWRCKTGEKQCIRNLYLCDGDNNCDHGEGEVCAGLDEDRICTNPFTGEAYGWRCKTGNKKCIKKWEVCDGRKHCDDGSDEGEVCGGFIEDRSCINPFTQEANTQTWHCISGNNKCVKKSDLCDDENHCDDGSDEGEVCGGFAEDRTCKNPFTGEAYGWRCKTGNKKCINKLHLCDGRKHCDDGSDEGEVCGGFIEDRSCINPFTEEANTETWHCVSGNNKCITKSDLCDGKNHCDDGSDEDGICGGFAEDRTCTSPINGEEVGWRCKTGNKKCISNVKLCDKVSDCEGGEDESFCNLPSLQPGCHLTGCHTCATDATILTSFEFWNGSVDQCRRCHLKEGLDLSNLPTYITWRRCNDGSCYNNREIKQTVNWDFTRKSPFFTPVFGQK